GKSWVFGYLTARARALNSAGENRLSNVLFVVLLSSALFASAVALDCSESDCGEDTFLMFMNASTPPSSTIMSNTVEIFSRRRFFLDNPANWRVSTIGITSLVYAM